MAEKGTETNDSGGMHALPRLDVTDGIVLSVIGDERSDAKEKCINKDFGGDTWREVSMDGTPVERQRRKEQSVPAGCLHAIG